MSVLAFDTCFTACSVAVRADRPGAAAVSANEHQPMETGHAEALTPMIARVMREAGLDFMSLKRIVVTHGPGTFTGVRTGVAAARALALASDVEIVAVSSLWAMAAEVNTALDQRAPFDAVLVAMDARKGQLYVQVVDRNGAELNAPLLLDANAAAALFPDRRLVVVGNAATDIVAAARTMARSTIMDAAGAGAANPSSPDAKYLLAAAQRSSISAPLVPLYLRPPDAKPQADKSLPWSSP